MGELLLFFIWFSALVGVCLLCLLLWDMNNRIDKVHHATCLLRDIVVGIINRLPPEPTVKELQSHLEKFFSVDRKG